MNNPQLPLGLALRDSARFESFFGVQNGELLTILQQAATGTGETLVYLAGADGLGKTHLLQAACRHATQAGRSSTYLPLSARADLAPEVLAGLEQVDLVCLDDIQAIAGDAPWERGVFDLFNRVRAAGGTLLVAGQQRPDRAGLALPDLVSRLTWGVTYVLKPLAEADVLAALDWRARSRGLELPDVTARFLIKRLPRDLPTVFDLLDRLDEASMVEQRRLTVPFVKAVLGLE
ncbi:MAG TPA: DnaA regulatory inactivator Hda [Gammaproteobacteria bacterium]|nr:DnaA regulatory inactivator Hda [Gammaproteobacteria bacterium]